MITQCKTCNWRYLAHRHAVHHALHDFLPEWPCAVVTDLGNDLNVFQVPLGLAAILVHGLYQLQPYRQVFFIYNCI